MQIQQTVLLRHSCDEVWALFQDVPTLARCMPGAELTEDRGDGKYAGKVSIKLGPFTANFEGEVEHHPDPQSFTGRATGAGTDRRGGSRSRMTMDYALREADEGTELSFEADVQLSGPIAQFGRPAIVTETAKHLFSQFAANVEASLDGSDAMSQASELNALKLGSKVVGASVKRWMGKNTD